MTFDKNSINYKHLLLGLLLNILVIIVFLLIYHAYIISPRLRTSAMVGSQEARVPSVPVE